MNRAYFAFLLLAAAAAPAPLSATITFTSLTSSVPTPQPLGARIKWQATATGSSSGPLTFQFNVIPPSGKASMVYDFNRGANNAGVWTSPEFEWATIAGEGVYQVQVVARDFSSGETQTQSASFTLLARTSGGQAVVNPTDHPLVALFSAPACPLGSSMQVLFQEARSAVSNATDLKACTGNTSMNFYVAGMYPSTTYTMNYQVQNGSTTNLGPDSLSFTTGPLPSNVPFPVFTVEKNGTDTQQPMILDAVGFSGGSEAYFPVATDMSGQIMWYYAPGTASALLTRPLADETMLAIQHGSAWTTYTTVDQLILEFDLAGNVVHESDTGVVQQELLALGASDAGPCDAVPNPAPIGAACLSFFNHEVMRLPNGYTAVLATLEKIFPPGTQPSSSKLPVDIQGDIIVVLDANWQAVWYWDSFDPAGGGNGYPKLPISRAAVLDEKCVSGGFLCGPVYLAGAGTADAANDWLHGNSLYYIPSSGDFLMSLRNQDWLIKIDYNHGTGAGNVLWRMGNAGDFTFNNLNSDPWPWFSGQHEAGYANNGAGPLTVFDDGNTRRADPPLGLGSTGCEPSNCASRGMALTVDETRMTVTPVLSDYLNVTAQAYGSAQLLENGDYYFDAGFVQDVHGYGLEVLPRFGGIDGTINYKFEGPTLYRSFRLANLYQPPTP